MFFLTQVFILDDILDLQVSGKLLKIKYLSSWDYCEYLYFDVAIWQKKILFMFHVTFYNSTTQSDMKVMSQKENFFLCQEQISNDGNYKNALKWKKVISIWNIK